MPPSISIIIPTFNSARTFPECLENIEKQAVKDVEVIVVDNGSTDGTAEWLSNYESTHHSLFIIRNSSNFGAPKARNQGRDIAQGEYILFCDADVVMRPDMLQKMRAALEAHPEASYAYASFQFGWKTFRLWPFDAATLRQMPYVHSTSLIRRAHCPRWDESLQRLQDWDLFLTMLEAGHAGIFVPEVLFKKTRKNSIMSEWLPSCAYKIPWFPAVKRYRAAEAIVKKKHGL